MTISPAFIQVKLRQAQARRDEAIRNFLRHRHKREPTEEEFNKIVKLLDDYQPPSGDIR